MQTARKKRVSDSGTYPLLGEGATETVCPPILPPLPVDSVIPAPDGLQPTAQCYAGYDLIVAIDTEYQTHSEENELLSFQFTALHQKPEGQWRLTERVLFYTNVPRPTLPELLSHVFQAFHTGRSRQKVYHVLLLAHHGVAEWAMLRDRLDLLELETANGKQPGLSPVRGVPVSLGWLSCVVPLPDAHNAKVNVAWRDTRLLAPDKRGGLEAISKLTRYPKVELPVEEKERMAAYLAEDPQGFLEYAIGDTRATLAYHLLVCQKAETLLEVTKMPMTLGDLSVKAYRTWLKTHPFLTEALVIGKCKMRYWYEQMAADAYYGGFNVAVRKGTCHTTTEDIILDIDFSSAYPAALAVIPSIDWEQPPRQVQSVEDIAAAYQRDLVLSATPVALPIMFLACGFEFSPSEMFPCLPMLSRYGLLYPSSDLSVFTGIEAALALAQGGLLQVVDGLHFQPLRDADGRVVLFAADYLGMLTRARQQAKQAGLEVDQLMLKETANSFYGKLAQGIRRRTLYNLFGVSKQLRRSRITTPHYAAMCTGLVRAALLAVCAAIDATPGCAVLSATTDGCMVKVPGLFEPTVDEAGKVRPPDIKTALGEKLYGTLSALFPVRLMQQGRVNMGLDAEGWLEVKHVGDKALTVKTRGYALRYRGVLQHLARAGLPHTTPDEFLEELYFNTELCEVPGGGLASMTAIINGKYKDLIDVSYTRKANLDWDYKRIPLADGSMTRPPDSVAEVMERREIAGKIRAGGHRATDDTVEALIGVKKPLRGGPVATIRRTIHQAIAHRWGGWFPRERGCTMRVVSKWLNIPYETFRKYKQRPFHPQPYRQTPLVEQVMREEAEKLGLQLTPVMIATICSRDAPPVPCAA